MNIKYGSQVKTKILYNILYKKVNMSFWEKLIQNNSCKNNFKVSANMSKFNISRNLRISRRFLQQNMC